VFLLPVVVFRVEGIDTRPSKTEEIEDRPEVDLFEGRIVAGRYRLIEQVAVGGMGAVWSGRDVQLGREIAVKFMDAGAAEDPTLRGRFDRETRAVAQLRSPYIVEVYDHGIEDGIPFLVMELLHGQMLNALFRRRRSIGLSAAGRIAAQVGKALTCAHNAGIVHRDLKPQNIFLAKMGDETIVKVLDFGIAKRSDEELDEATKAGEILGSPYYMSPEQARGLKSVDHRSDLWSFAVVLYRALTGHRLFEGEAMGDVLVRVCTDTPPAPSSHVPALGPATDLFFAKALARDANERFQSAAEMVEAFLQLAPSAQDLSLTQVMGTFSAPIGTGSFDETPVSYDGLRAPGETSGAGDISGVGEVSGVGDISSPGAVSQRSQTVGALVATGAGGQTARRSSGTLLGVVLASVAGIGIGVFLFIFQSPSDTPVDAVVDGVSAVQPDVAPGPAVEPSLEPASAAGADPDGTDPDGTDPDGTDPVMDLDEPAEGDPGEDGDAPADASAEPSSKPAPVAARPYRPRPPKPKPKPTDPPPSKWGY